MKRFFLFSILLFCLTKAQSQTQLNLTFIGRDSTTQNLLSLDSLRVKNLTENRDTLLFGPVPMLSLLANWPVGINEIDVTSSGTLTLEQNYPNPFQGSTNFNINREYGGKITLILFDELGTKLTEYQNTFEKGDLSFLLSSSENKVLILMVSDDYHVQSIKIVSNGEGSRDNNIQFMGQNAHIKLLKTKNPDNSNFIFYLGNKLQYTAHANGYYTNSKTDFPISSTTYYFNMIPVVTSSIPTLTTSNITNITQTSATSGGDITSDGGASVSERGVCWSTSPNPIYTGIHTSDGNGIGSYISYLTGLSANTQYHVRAYAVNSVGAGYGNEIIFTTGQNTTTPSVTTTAITNIGQTTAISGGDVTSDGGTTVTARGVCWSTSLNPTIANNFTTDGTGTGIFTSNLTGLTGGTFYHVRAYATNSQGTSYGNDLTFTTLTTPTVTTSSITNITQTTATSGGIITSDGGAPVTARGVCWNTSSNPTTSNNFTIDGSGTGTYVSNLTGLNSGTLYHVRAYATNNVGTAYGNDVVFTTNYSCGQPLTDSRDNKVYNTVLIGTQCWMAQNLNIGIMITHARDQTNNDTIEKYCNGDSSVNCDVYGGLYEWGEAVQYLNGATNTTTWNPVPTGNVQGVCPSGWHIPTNTEWCQMETLLDPSITNCTYIGIGSTGGSMGDSIGGLLKETGFAHWSSPNNGATNSHGFTALGGGNKCPNVLSNCWTETKNCAYFLTSTEGILSDAAALAWEHYICHNYASMGRSLDYKTYGYSIRCVKD